MIIISNIFFVSVEFHLAHVKELEVSVSEILVLLTERLPFH